MKTTLFAFLSFFLIAAATIVAQPTRAQMQPDSTPPAQGWTRLTSGTTAGFNFISLVGPDTVYVSGDASGKPILRSTDAGATWDSLPQWPRSSGRLQFVDDTTAFLSADSIFQTTDGGSTWKSIRGRERGNRGEVVFGSRNNGIDGWGAVTPGDYTTDGGTTWHPGTGGTWWNNITTMIFADSLHAYAMGSVIDWWRTGKVFSPACERSTDGGATWQDVYTGPYNPNTSQFHSGIGRDIYGMAALNADTVFTVGLQIGRTFDAGADWDTVKYPGDGYNGFFAVAFPDSRHGTAVGSGGFIFHTTDAGLTWQKQFPPYLGNYGSVAFVDSALGYACGTEGVIIKTMNGGLSWVRLFPGLDSVQGAIFPNPANTLTTISYALPQPQHVTLTILDLSGNVVAQILNGVLQSGTQSIPINTSPLASGTYIYSLHTEKYSATGKFQIIH